MKVKKSFVSLIMMLLLTGVFLFADDVGATETVVNGVEGEPQIISVTPDPKSEGILKNLLVRDRDVVISFDRNVSVADMSKLSIETFSGTEASMLNFVEGEDYISFQIDGDSTTKAMFTIEPGFVSSSDGVYNTWSYTYEIDFVYEITREKEALGSINCDPVAEVYDVYYDELNDTVYAIVSGSSYSIYWVKVDKDNNFTKVKLELSQGINYGEIIPLDENAFLLSHESFSGNFVREFFVIDKDGNILSEYAIEYDGSYSWEFTNAIGLKDGSIYYLTSMGNGEELHEIQIDDEYQITTRLVMDNMSTADSYGYTEIFAYKWFATDNAIVCMDFGEDENDPTKQKMAIWRIQDYEFEKREIILENECAYKYFDFSGNIIEDDESYMIILSGRTSSMVDIYAIRLSKDDLEVMDYTCIFKEETCKDISGFIVKDVLEITEDEYIIVAHSIAEEYYEGYTEKIDVDLYIYVDKCFNVKWVQSAWDVDESYLMVKDSGKIFNFLRSYDCLEYYQLESNDKEMNNFLIKNNLSNETETYRIVKDGQLRYCIPQKEGYAYTVYVNGKKVEVTDNVLVYDTSLGELTDNVVQINYSNASGMHKADDGQWYYYKAGAIDTTYTGMAKNEYGWWYMKNGKLDQTYTGMAKNEYGWWYMKNGKLDWSYTGMAKNQYGWWYIKNGKLDWSYTGMAKNQYGWWYMKNGKLDWSYTGMAKNQYGWWYMKNGKLDWSYTGMAKNQYGWWYISEGNINFKYTDIASNQYGTWYMKNGKLDTAFSGKVTINGKMYTIKNGKVM